MASPSPSAKATKEEPPEDLNYFDNDPDVAMADENTGDSNPNLDFDSLPQVDGPSDDREAHISALEAQVQASQMPLRKDISLREFMSKMDDYAPIIPDAVTAYALTLAGLPPPSLGASKDGAAQDPNATPLPMARLLALATQKFVADIAADAYQYSRMRSGNLTSNTLSAMSNPGAVGAGVGGGGAPGGAPGGPGAGGGGDGKGGEKGGAKQAGQHNLGMQRPGFGGGGQGGGQGRTVLTMEDLGMAVGEYGVNVKRGEFYR